MSDKVQLFLPTLILLLLEQSPTHPNTFSKSTTFVKALSIWPKLVMGKRTNKQLVQVCVFLFNKNMFTSFFFGHKNHYQNLKESQTFYFKDIGAVYSCESSTFSIFANIVNFENKDCFSIKD